MTQEQGKPTGGIRPVRAIPRGKLSSLAVYATVICVDENGKEWSWDTSCFGFDLKPYVAPENNS